MILCILQLFRTSLHEMSMVFAFVMVKIMIWSTKIKFFAFVIAKIIVLTGKREPHIQIFFTSSSKKNISTSLIMSRKNALFGYMYFVERYTKILYTSLRIPLFLLRFFGLKREVYEREVYKILVYLSKRYLSRNFSTYFLFTQRWLMLLSANLPPFGGIRFARRVSRTFLMAFS